MRGSDKWEGKWYEGRCAVAMLDEAGRPQRHKVRKQASVRACVQGPGGPHKYYGRPVEFLFWFLLYSDLYA